MPRKRAREAEADERVDAPALWRNPLRDRALLEKAARQVAASLVRDRRRRVTAMQFCIETLESLGLREIAIGQAERIFLSSVRKAALGALDAELVVKPEAAGAVDLPPLALVRDTLDSGRLSMKPPAATADVCDRIRKSLLEHMTQRVTELRSRSIIHIKGFLNHPDGELQPIAASLAQHPKSTTFLRLSSGTGRGGGYSEVDLRKCPILEALRSALTTVINETLNHDRMLGQKVVVTRYGVGGVNWAHADQSEGGYQAYLLMSRPGVDFTGGEFYITSPGAPADDATRQIAWRMPGDLVIFAANAHECTADGREPRSWLHGFREVRSGSGGAESSHLCVVGLLE